MSLKLSRAQQALLATAPEEWAELPYQVRYYTPTLTILAGRRLVETKREGNTWYWRKPQMSLLQAAEALCDVLPKSTLVVSSYFAREELLRLRRIIEKEKNRDQS